MKSLGRSVRYFIAEESGGRKRASFVTRLPGFARLSF
jgi:hypothetical protein